MGTFDLRSSFFLLALSVAALAESFHMGIGTVQSPGMGFMPFAVSGLLGILSLILLLRTICQNRERRIKLLLSGTNKKKALIALIALAVYSRLMPVVGYLIATFCLMSFLYWFLEPNRARWVFWSLILSFLTTIGSYYLFSVLLNCQFPAGLFGL